MCRVLLAIILCVPATKAFCGNSYGPCPYSYPQHYSPKKFTPAPKGQTPTCATPGLTFCDKIDTYPKQIVKHLIQNLEFNFNTLLRDESKDNFGKRDPVPYGVHDETSTEFPGYDYSPAVMVPPRHHPYIPPPFLPINSQAPGHYDESRLPSFTTSAPHKEYPSFTTAKPQNFHDKKFTSLTNEAPYSDPFYDNKFKPQSSYYDPMDWLTRYKRSNQSEGFSLSSRARRQANRGSTETLCPTRTMYVMPQAALNNQGSWKYVVNLNSDKNTQFVQSEVCVSSQCNNICSLPNGYTSRCEQKYVQKRLVALSDDGNNIYNDIFWFPHGCVCQFSTPA